MGSATLARVWARSWSSIRGRLVLSFILIALVAIGIVGGFSGALLKHFVERRERAYLQSNAATVALRARSLMVPVARPLSLGDLVRTAAFITDSRIRILDRERRVLVDSGPQDDSDHVWLRMVATISAGDTVVRHRVWIPVSSDPTQNAALRRSLPALQRIGGDTQAMVVRRRSGLWGSFIEFQDYEGPLLTAAAPDAAAAADDTMRDTHTEPIGDPVNPVGYVEIARSPDLTGEALDTVIGPFIIAALAATVLAALLGLVFGRRLTAPIAGLTSSAVRMGSGDLAARAPFIGSGEIGELGRQFNAMAGKLELTVRDLRQERDVLRRFVADASHELRTPVTALKTFNELLLAGAELEAAAAGAAAPPANGGAPEPPPAGAAAVKVPPWRRPVAAAAALAAGLRTGGRRGIDAQKRIEFLGESHRQIQRMEWIVENLLNLSRLESGATARQSLRVTLGDLVRGAERRAARAAAAAGVRVAVEVTAPAGERELESADLEIALDNVLQNAVRYGGAGGEVRISAAEERGRATIRVRDRGPGIAADDLPHIFNRFYRGKQAGAARGSGLGLAIARAVVQANGGNITAANNLDGPGAAITLHLPLREPAPDGREPRPPAARRGGVAESGKQG